KFRWVLQWLEDTFSINAEKCVLHSLEFGCNLTDLDIPTGMVLSNLIVYKNKPFSKLKKMIGRGDGYDAESGQTRLKLYDKRLHYGLAQPIFRFELKLNKNQAIQRVFNANLHLSDLSNLSYW